MPTDLGAVAASLGHQHILEWLRAENMSLENVGPSAAGNGHLGILKWMYSQNILLDYWTFSAAAKCGHLEILKWVASIGLRFNVRLWDVHKWKSTAENRNALEIFQLVFDADGMYNDHSCDYGSRIGSVDLILWALERGCQLRCLAIFGNSNVLNNLETIRLMWSKGLRDFRIQDAVKTGNYDSVYFLATMQNADSETFNEIAKISAEYGHHLGIFKWAALRLALKCDYYECCLNAASNGHLSILQYCGGLDFGIFRLKKPIKMWDEETFNQSIVVGNFSVISFLRSVGCRWNKDSSMYAASSGNLDILKWLRLEGCPWDFRTRESAIKIGHEEMINWLDDKRCPIKRH
jgi:hypothetical protein